MSVLTGNNGRISLGKTKLPASGWFVMAYRCSQVIRFTFSLSICAYPYRVLSHQEHQASLVQPLSRCDKTRNSSMKRSSHR